MAHMESAQQFQTDLALCRQRNGKAAVILYKEKIQIIPSNFAESNFADGNFLTTDHMVLTFILFL